MHGVDQIASVLTQAADTVYDVTKFTQHRFLLFQRLAKTVVFPFQIIDPIHEPLHGTF